jgi:hypothetical protein
MGNRIAIATAVPVIARVLSVTVVVPQSTSGLFPAVLASLKGIRSVLRLRVEAFCQMTL